MKRAAFPVVVVLLAAACADSRLPVDVAGPQLAVSDGAHGGLEGFYFFPPIVPTPTFDGVFNPDVRPRVNVWGPFDNEAAAQCTSHEASGAVVHFQSTDISVDAAAEVYSVGWQTGQSNLISEKVYRICVWSRTLDKQNNVVWVTLGFRDVKPEDTNDDNRSTDQAPVYEFKNGSNLPIKFRIEKGVTCGGAGVADCTEAVLDNTGGTAVCSDGTCAIEVPDGALQGEVVFQVQQVICAASEEVNPVFIEQLDLPQFPGCIVVNSSQAEFDPPIVVAACVSQSAALDRLETNGVLDDDKFHRLQLHHLRSDGGVEALPNTFSAIDAECDQQLAAGPKPETLWEYASAGIRAVQRVLLPWTAPEPAYAINRGFGGSTSTTSPFIWALPAQVEKLNWTNPKLVQSGSEQTVEVLVTDAGNVDDCSVVAEGEPCVPVSSGSQPVWGARVHFEVTSVDGGSVTPLVVTTGPSGVASATWTIGGAGTHTLDASGLGLGIAPSEGGTGPFATHFATGDPVDAIVQLGAPPLTFVATVCPAPLPIDGTIEADYGTPIPFTAKLSGGSTSAWLYTYNDCDNLYVVVAVATTDANLGNSLVLVFDNTLNGPSAEDDQLMLKKLKSGAFEFQDRYLTSGCLNSKQADCGALDTSNGGASNGAGATAHANSRFVYEVSHPLNSGDARDFALSIGNQVGMFLALQLGSGAQGNTQWPAFRQYHTINITQP
jgi:hypothetical protein